MLGRHVEQRHARSAERQVFEAGSWNVVRASVDAVCCESRHAIIHWPAWDVFVVDEKMMDCHTKAPGDVEKHLMNRVKLKW